MKKIILAITVILAILSVNMVTMASDSSNSGSVKSTVTKASAAKAEITDISGHWAEKAINRVVEKTMFASDDGKFQPDKPITRSEFALFLHKALGIQIMYLKATDIGEFFTDVKNEDSYASALYDLAITNIIDFRGTFKPQSTLTREEMVHFIMNAYKYKMGENFKQIKLSSVPFADNDNITIDYSGQITRAEHDGLIKRPADNKFHPKDAATRAQTVTVADRLLTLIDRETAEVSVVPTAEIKDGRLQMKLTITNNLAEKIVMNHSSGQKFDFVLLDANMKVLYRWSADKMFTMALTQTAVEPGKSIEFSADAGKDIYNGAQGKAVYVKAYITGSSDNFKINADGYEAVIQ